MVQSYIRWNDDGNMERVRTEVTPLGKDERVLASILTTPPVDIIVPLQGGKMRVAPNKLEVAIEFHKVPITTSFAVIKIADQTVGLTPTYKAIQNLTPLESLMTQVFDLGLAFPGTSTRGWFVQEFIDSHCGNSYMVFEIDGHLYQPPISNVFADARCCLGTVAVDAVPMRDPITYTHQLFDELGKAQSNQDLAEYALRNRVTWTAEGVIQPVSVSALKKVSNSSFNWVVS